MAKKMISNAQQNSFQASTLSAVCQLIAGHSSLGIYIPGMTTYGPIRKNKRDWWKEIGFLTIEAAVLTFGTHKAHKSSCQIWE